MNQWAALLACRYNGCCSTSSLCTSRANGYRDNALVAYADMGADFWRAVGCTALPADGVIAPRSSCYIAGGDPRYWRHESPEWTATTAEATAENFGEWIIKVPTAGRYHVDVDLEGGESKQAAYVIAHAGVTETVIVDQTSATGFVSLGAFDFTGTGDEHVLLGDNTGEDGVQLAFTSIRVESVDAPPPPTVDSGCGCQTGGGGAAAGGFAFVVLTVVGRRRRR
jgi:MYXO-CTERM domain-containing protein